MTGPSPEETFLRLAAERGLRPPRRGHIEKTLSGISSFFTSSLFREETARRPGLLQGIDPRAKLAATVLYLASVSAARTTGALAAHAFLPATALVLSRIRPFEFLRAGFLVALLFSLLMAAPAALSVFRDGTVIVPLFHLDADWRLGPLFIPRVVGITREGLLSAETLLLRVLSSVAAALWLTLSTRWTDLLRALRFFRLPAIFVLVAGMTVRYLYALLRQAEDIHLGKTSRTVCRARIATEQAWAGSRIACSWERSLHLMDEVSAAMKARGFAGEARFPAGARFRGADWALIVAVAISCLGAHAF
ncbi:MAG: energy-coupling factor transporter transmembrane component T family protein [Deltaproteobacteria bacterium]